MDTAVTDLTALKARARKDAFARRKAAHAQAAPDAGGEFLAQVLLPHAGKTLSGYMPIRTEISPLKIMARHAAHATVCVPVIRGPGRALEFHQWTPDCEMQAGAFGAFVPAAANPVEPDVLIVPLVAFDRQGNRLGYGGGFYDRTLQGLRAKRPTIAIGFAYGAQEATTLPLEPTDQKLDMIVTEREVLRFS